MLRTPAPLKGALAFLGHQEIEWVLSGDFIAEAACR